MLLLRPGFKTADAVIDFIDTKLRRTGYRLVGAFAHSSGSAVSIVGFRELWSTAWGHSMYLDDVSTLQIARGNGFADELLRWVIADAKRRQCEESTWIQALEAIGQRHIGCTCETACGSQPITSRSKSTADEIRVCIADAR